MPTMRRRLRSARARKKVRSSSVAGVGGDISLLHQTELTHVTAM
jgi:hypothetical protein